MHHPRTRASLFADNKLKDEVKLALANTKNRKINGVKNAFLSLIQFSELTISRMLLFLFVNNLSRPVNSTY